MAKDSSLEEGLLDNLPEDADDEMLSDVPPPLPPKFIIGSQELLDCQQPECSESKTSEVNVDSE